MGYDNSPALVLLLGGDPAPGLLEEPPLEESLEESLEDDDPPEDPLAATLAIKPKIKIE